MNPKRYRCIKAFDIAQADDDGAIIENAPTIHVPVGKEYELTQRWLNLDVYLIADDGGWLDLDWETFKACFKEVTE